MEESTITAIGESIHVSAYQDAGLVGWLGGWGVGWLGDCVIVGEGAKGVVNYLHPACLAC